MFFRTCQYKLLNMQIHSQTLLCEGNKPMHLIEQETSPIPVVISNDAVNFPYLNCTRKHIFLTT